MRKKEYANKIRRKKEWRGKENKEGREKINNPDPIHTNVPLEGRGGGDRDVPHLKILAMPLILPLKFLWGHFKLCSVAVCSCKMGRLRV